MLLRDLRRRSGMTQEELAQRLGYSRSMVAALETDRRHPDVNAVVDIFVPALNLLNSPDFALQLVSLAAEARQLSTPALTLPQHRPLLPVPTDAEGRLHRMPSAPTRLIGRNREVQHLSDQILYDDVRLLTLLGSPGVGKTRLAQAVASRMQLFLSDGACWVPLAGVASAEQVVSSILEALDPRLQGGTPLARIVAYLRQKQILLVLDNFEQLLDAAPLVAQILAECAGVRMIVTSRERLHLRAEHLVQVQPLSAPAAAELFMARVDAADPTMALEAIDQKTVDDICRRLDYLPLALELCAAQADYYSLGEILKRLQSHLLDTLDDGASDLPERHRTLRAAIGASYDALTNDEQSMLRTLSIFVGGCTPESAIDLWSVDRDEATRQPDKLLRSLVAKSLVHIETTAQGDRRLYLLQSIWDYAREQLIEEGELETLRKRHSKVMLAYAQSVATKKWGREAVQWSRRIKHEWDNFNAALGWTCEHEAWQAMATLLLLLNVHFESSARQSEYFAWYLRLLPYTESLAPDVQAMIKMNFCFGAHTGVMAERRKEILRDYHGLVAMCQNPLIKANLLAWGADLAVDFPDPLAAKMEALELARAGETTEESRLTFGIECTREVVLSKVLFMIGCDLYSIGRTSEATSYFKEVVQRSTYFHAFHDGFATGYLGRVALSEGRLEDATELMEAAVSQSETMYDLSGIAVWRSFLGMAHVYAGNVEQAKPILSQAWEGSCVVGNPFFSQIASLGLAELAMANSELEEARGWIAESIRLSEQSSHEVDWRNLHRILLTARLAATEGRDAEATLLYGLWHAYNKSILVGPYGPVLDNAIIAMAEVRQRLGDYEYERIYTLGSQLPRQETVAALRSFLTGLA